VSQRNGSPKGLPRGTRGPDAHVEVGQVFPAPPAGVIVVVDVVPVPTIHVQSPSPSSKLGFEQPSDTDEHCVGGVAAAVVVGGPAIATARIIIGVADLFDQKISIVDQSRCEAAAECPIQTGNFASQRIRRVVNMLAAVCTVSPGRARDRTKCAGCRIGSHCNITGWTAANA